ncbi:EsaB/YukD family protein [Actinoplanes sp. NBRC 103695]|uniref:EsaB/YukD family protein n=1 Tax=Actinoplanes sp. NBRC 103695 TaxID=3032202 RepID=UPI0024A37090|nr:EsaB/YukD family protein [Actinoplanes sp. NBRC 103695]GLZ01026.1 hypothetical protein Acsp02_82770 [Actinoplanes sp. NBRC 103695]
MAKEQSRITVVGPQRRVDLAVPATTPIGEYAPSLAEMCGADESPTMPPAWSLAPADAPAFPIEATLGDLGVLDGQVLYLRDTAVEPGDPPVVMDVDEVVADETERMRRRRMHAGPVVLGFGLAWLLSAAVLAGWRVSVSTGSAIALLLTGLALMGVGWGLRQRPSAVPDWLLTVVVLLAMPCLAVSGLLIADDIAGAGLRWAGAVAGANLAALMALAATPGVVLLAVEAQLVIAGILVPLLIGLEADHIEAAALVAAVAAALTAVSRRLAAMLTVWGTRMPKGRRAAAEATTNLVAYSGRLCAVVLAGPTIALVITLPVLALSGQAFAVAVATTLTVAMLVRARQAAFTNELLMSGGVAMAGLFSLFTPISAAIGATGAAGEVLLLVGGGTVAAIGIGMSLLLAAPADQPVPDPNQPRKPRKRTRAEVMGGITAVAVAPLTVGVFGVYGDLIWLGRTLF